jgi:hypothetical protein
MSWEAIFGLTPARSSQVARLMQPDGLYTQLSPALVDPTRELRRLIGRMVRSLG